jgi:hypothetical protein
MSALTTRLTGGFITSTLPVNDPLNYSTMYSLRYTLFRLSFFTQLFFTAPTADAQTPSPWKKITDKPVTLDMKQGMISFHTPAFELKLLKSSQTVASISPAAAKTFDFSPGELLEKRNRDGLYHLGDLNLRFRESPSAAWQNISTAAKRSSIRPIAGGGKILAAADLAATLPSWIPLQIRRFWELTENGIVLRFSIKNTGTKIVELGSLGIPMIFNNVMLDKTLEQTHAQNVFYDPYIGEDAGYVQVTRLSGKGPVLLVVPYGKTPLEAYNPLLDDPTPKGVTFEGFYEWMPLSKAYAEQDWKGAEQWNLPSSLLLKPGESHDYGVKFILASSVRNIESRLIKEKRPVAVGIPGYVIPQDVNASLFLKYPYLVKHIDIYPREAMSLKVLPGTKGGWQRYLVKGDHWGRARVTLTYEDGTVQTISYKVIKPEIEAVSDFGRFLTHQQWYTNEKDPFGRNNSVISYDNEKKEQVTQDSRAWIPGLSDEGGAGAWLGAIMKELITPDKEELRLLQLFVNHTLWGGLQHSGGKEKFGVKKSMFYYEPAEMPASTYSDSINYKTWAAWNHKTANDVGRSYNYPHVAAAHWVLYRLARYHTALVDEKKWDWYLENAYQTAMAMVSLAPYYAQFGQMEGSVFLYILQDLKAEGWAAQASALEAAMKLRAGHWRTLKFPFGSEMPWDSTGQEEVFVWSDYFGYADKAKITIDAILGYMPTVPHWGYNGSARRYWDFLYGGKLSRIERQLHHYGSSLNAIPVLKAYQNDPSDFYLLRVGYGGLMGAIANITADGFGPSAFHSFPSTLKADGLSGDYGSGFYGYAVNTATYITLHPEFGWLAFGGNLQVNGSWIETEITTARKSAVFIAPAGLWLSLDAGTFKSVAYNTKTSELCIRLAAADRSTPNAYLTIKTSALTKQYIPEVTLKKVRGTYIISLGEKDVSLQLRLK